MLISISEYLPVTVMSAILLFAMKETIEFCRRHRVEKRKLDAIKYLISIEIQLNYWAVTSLFKIFNGINDFLKLFPQAEFWLYTSPSGTENIRYSEEGNRERYTNYWIPPIVDKQYKTLLPTIAELNEKLFRSLENAHDNLVELNHLRSLLIDHIEDKENNEGLTYLAEISIKYEKTCKEALTAVYFNCAGKPLQEARLRW